MDNEFCFFETHAHYDHERFKGEGPHILKHLFDEGIVSAVVIPPITYDSNASGRKMFPIEEFPNVFFAAGLHPKKATDEKYWDKNKKEQFMGYVHDPRTVAIKTGLDFCKKKLHAAQKERQVEFFRYFIRLANQEKLPLILHIRDAAEDAIEVLKEEQLEVEAVVHCYSYDYAIAERMMEVGVTRFGFGGLITRDGMDNVRESVKKLSLERVLLETDSPLVKPQNYNKELNTSETLIEVAKKLAHIKGIPLETVIEVANNNAREFYRL